ncbi:MAG: DUF1365 family protein [Candidatus Eremiobacteraeota bacterium]|nr:DUF1365 family protein [Candidatus Eremiobacteraeota bacterium]
MNSKIFIGEVVHARQQPVSHRFRYPVYYYAIDLQELPELDRRLGLFGYNRWRPVALFDHDYLGRQPGSIAAKLMAELRERGLGEGIARVVLVTCARYFGYCFNPVSFYYCYGNDSEIRCIVAEVNNTFGERHLYVLDQMSEPLPGFAAHYRVAKSFYVSPFNRVEGDYDFRFAHLDDRLDAQIHVFHEQTRFFFAWVRGRSVPLDRVNLLATLVRFPVNAFLTMARIHWQAARLFFAKKLAITIKPNPTHPGRLRTDPSWLQRQAMDTICRFLAPMRNGRLNLLLPDGTRRCFGQHGAPVEVVVNNFDFFVRLLLGGDVALGETYTRHDWDCEDLTGFIRLFVDNREALDDKKLWLTWLARFANRANHWWNVRSGARSNIAAHYDLGNELFERFLDSSMTYSCAFFATPDQSLEQAQQNKLERILARAAIEPHHRVLEIGCGWGSFSLLAAARTGCRITAVTLSEQQHALAVERARQQGLSHLIDFRLLDYRQVQGRFDRIVSIEMIEAVGHDRLGEFFGHCDRLLAEGGRAVVQVITTPDADYETYRKHCDWIQKVIFPGSTCPSVGALEQAMRSHSRLRIESGENIGPHYAATLAEWRRRFNERWEELPRYGYDDAFRRTWNYYFSYCEAGFASRNLGDYQMVLSRPERSLI